MPSHYEICGVSLTKYNPGYELDEHEPNPWYTDNRAWIYPRNFGDLVDKTSGGKFIVELPYYHIELSSIGEIGHLSTGVEFLMDGNGESDFVDLFDKLVAEFEPVLKSYAPQDDLVQQVQFIGLFSYWYDNGDGWESDPDAGIEFVCRVDPRKLKLLQ